MDVNEAKAALNAAGYVVKKPMSCREAGSLGGRSKSERKRAASRENVQKATAARMARSKSSRDAGKATFHSRYTPDSPTATTAPTTTPVADSPATAAPIEVKLAHRYSNTDKE